MLAVMAIPPVGMDTRAIYYWRVIHCRASRIINKKVTSHTDVKWHYHGIGDGGELRRAIKAWRVGDIDATLTGRLRPAKSHYAASAMALTMPRRHTLSRAWRLVLVAWLRHAHIATAVIRDFGHGHQCRHHSSVTTIIVYAKAAGYIVTRILAMVLASRLRRWRRAESYTFDTSVY